MPGDKRSVVTKGLGNEKAFSLGVREQTQRGKKSVEK